MLNHPYLQLLIPLQMTEILLKHAMMGKKILHTHDLSYSLEIRA